jgi:hypothetical protein
MKRIYNQPEVQVAQFASMTLMQAASPANVLGIIPIEGDQW